MTDDQILAMKAQGRLKIDRETGRVWSWHSRRRKWIEKVADLHPLSGRARFRFDTPDVKRSTVYKNRLLFVYFNGATCGKLVDHKNGDRTDDAVDNLQLHGTDESGRQGNNRTRQIGLDYFNDWWDFVRFYGEPPPDHAKDLGSVYR